MVSIFNVVFVFIINKIYFQKKYLDLEKVMQFISKKGENNIIE